MYTPAASVCTCLGASRRPQESAPAEVSKEANYRGKENYYRATRRASALWGQAKTILESQRPSTFPMCKSLYGILLTNHCLMRREKFIFYFFLKYCLVRRREEEAIGGLRQISQTSEPWYISCKKPRCRWLLRSLKKKIDWRAAEISQKSKL